MTYLVPCVSRALENKFVVSVLIWSAPSTRLLIGLHSPDSQVFAEEVEPTGAVPMELSLERYRFAALPAKFPDNTAVGEDKRLKPRVSLKFFSGSQILINVSKLYLHDACKREQFWSIVSVK